jgi:hypothetical protein
LRRVHDFGERAADGAARADAEQILGGRIQISDEQAVVEHDECSRQTLQEVVRAGCAAWTTAAETRQLASRR